MAGRSRVVWVCGKDRAARGAFLRERVGVRGSTLAWIEAMDDAFSPGGGAGVGVGVDFFDRWAGCRCAWRRCAWRRMELVTWTA
jgi:hypothetical protein